MAQLLEEDEAQYAALSPQHAGVMRALLRVLDGTDDVESQLQWGMPDATLVTAFGDPSDTDWLDDSGIVVSCLCPTTPDRRWCHEHILRCFKRQTYKRKELVVLETGGEPSTFWRDEARRNLCVRYEHRPDDMVLGTKRQRLVDLAKGDALCHFDDDDVYGDAYVARALAALCGDGGEGAVTEARLATLSRWHSYDAGTGGVTLYDGAEDGGDVVAVVREAAGGDTKTLLQDYTRLTVEWQCRVFGYGFSYVYTRAFAQLAPFADADAQEDLRFVLDATAAAGEKNATVILYDASDVLHVAHGANASRDEVTRTLDDDERKPLAALVAAAAELRVPAKT